MNAHAARRAECEALILELIAITPMGNSDLAEPLGIGRKAVQRYTDAMLSDRRIHVCGHRMPAIGGNSRPLYAPGNLPDVPRVFAPKPGPTNESIRADRMARTLAALETPRSTSDLVAMLPFSVYSINSYIKEFRLHKKVRIAQWRTPATSGQWIPVYGLGAAADVLRPDGVSRSCKRAHARAKKKQQQEVPAKKGKIVSESTIATAKARPQSIFAALGL